MLVGFHHPRFDALAALWNDCYPPFYKISAELLKQHSVESPVFDWGASAIEIDDDAKPLGFVIVKQSGSKLYNGPDPDMAHISAIVCPTPGQGIELLSFVKNNLRNRGIYKLVFGTDSRHFFASCPTDLPQLKDLLTVEGFEEGGEFWDISQDLAKFEPRPSAMARITSGPEKVKVAPLEKDEIGKLDHFLKTEFPGRWRYDTLNKVKVEGRTDFIDVLWVNGELLGFSVTQDASHKLPINGGVFHESFGPDWCALGPIGVAASIRGKGLGDVLLASSVLRMKERGKRHCTIDWTGLKEWYGKHGFTVCRTYIPFSLKLEEAI